MRYNSQTLSDFTVTFPKCGKQNNNKKNNNNNNKNLNNVYGWLSKAGNEVAEENNVFVTSEPAAYGQK